MAGLLGMESVAIPAGWHKESMFGRLAVKGIVSVERLCSPATTMREVFAGLRILDLRDYVELKSRQAHSGASRIDNGGY